MDEQNSSLLSEAGEYVDVNTEKGTGSILVAGIMWVVFEAVFSALGYFVSKWLFIPAIIGMLPVVAFFVVESTNIFNESDLDEDESDYD